MAFCLGNQLARSLYFQGKGFSKETGLVGRLQSLDGFDIVCPVLPGQEGGRRVLILFGYVHDIGGLLGHCGYEGDLPRLEPEGRMGVWASGFECGGYDEKGWVKP